MLFLKRIIPRCLVGAILALGSVVANTVPVADPKAVSSTEETSVEFNITGSDAESHYGTLTDYSRQGGIIDLTNIPDNLSGVTWNTETGTLFMIRNQSGAAQCYEYTTLGGYLRTIAQQNFVDTEAISWMYGSIFAIGEENNAQRITICTIDAQTSTLNRLGNPSWTSSLGNLANLGLECMCYNPEADRLYYCSEKPSGGHWYIYAMNPSTGVSSILCDLQTTIAATSLATDLSDMAYDRGARNLLLLSHESNKVIRVSIAGAVLESLNNLGFAQAEGITISPDRKQLFICGETRQFARYTLPASTLTYAIANPPAHGTLQGLAPSLIYKPDLNFFGVDTFTFTTNDGTDTSSPATVTITVSGVNDAPSAVAQSVSTPEDTPRPITLESVDPDGDTLNFTITQQPAHGTLSGTPPNLTWTPAPNYFGLDSFAFTVSDGVLTSPPATIQLSVVSVNDAPVALAQSFSINEDDSQTITLSGTDTEGDAISFRVSPPPAHGTLSGVLPNLTYVPEANFHGADEFIIIANDGILDGAPASITFSIASVNDAPQALPQLFAAIEDTALGVVLTGSDVDGDVLTYTILTSPSRGTLIGNPPSLQYVPAANAYGPDSFTFQVTDGTVLSGPATVSIAIAAVNDAPVAQGQNIATNEDMPVPIILNGTDVENDTLAYAVTTPPSHGTLSGTPPNITYIPSEDFYGADNFSFTVFDGVAFSEVAAVSIEVAAVNDIPVAASQAMATEEDTPIPLILSGTDNDGDPLQYIISSPPTNGSLGGTAPNFIYTPDANFHGTDSVTFIAKDGATDSMPASIGISVSSINDPPSAHPQTIAAIEDTPVPIILAGSDVDGDALSFVVTAGPEHGTISGVEPNLIYTPNSNFHGTDHFSFAVSDGMLTSAPSEITLPISAVNDSPIVAPQSLETMEDSSLAITLTASDADDDAVFFLLTAFPAHGTLAGTLPNLRYVPAANFHGEDSITLRGFDGQALGNPTVIHISILPVNDAPIALGQSASATEDVSLNLTLIGLDVDGDELSYAIASPPLHGSLIGTPPDVTYVPDANYHGADNFTFVVNDGTVASNSASVQMVISSVNDQPVAPPLELETIEDTALTILLSATDADADALTYAILEQPQHGVLLGSPPLITYLPDPNYHGVDGIRYVASDGSATSPPAIAIINVGSENDVPTASAVPVQTLEDSSVAITLTGLDADADALNFTVTLPPAHGTLSGTPPTVTYTPNLNFHGSDSFSYVANDGTATSPPSLVSIAVESVNDAPVAESQTLTTPEDIPQNLTLTAFDVDGDWLVYQLISGPSHGALSGEAPNLVYTPAANYHGTDNFVFTVSDGLSASNQAVIHLVITPVNDAPAGQPQVLETAEDIALPVTLSGSDADGDDLLYEITVPPSHGTLSGSAPNFTYTPNANFHGLDQLHFTVGDGLLTSAPIIITISITPVNDAPVSIARSLLVQEDATLAVLLEATDEDGDLLTYRVLQQPQHGMLAGTPPSLFYTPAPNYNGTDNITFAADDGTTESAPVAISITVAAANDPPLAQAQVVSTNEDVVVGISLSGNDVEGMPLLFEITLPPLHGTLTGAPPEMIYTPDPNFHGADQFLFRTNDGELNSLPALVQVEVNSVNDRPISKASNVSTLEDTSLAISLEGTDADEDALEFAITIPPSHGTLSGSPPAVIYHPEANYHGTDHFSFKATDGVTDSLEAEIQISVTSVNDQPKANSPSVTTSEDVPIPIQLSGTDDDMDTLNFSVVEAPRHGVLSGLPPDLIYTPCENFHGRDSFRFIATDGIAESAEAVGEILITPVNDAPEALPQSLAGLEDTSRPIKLNGADVDGDPLIYTITTPPLHGTLSGIPPNLIYSPEANFHGADQFSFTVSDTMLTSAPAVVSFAIASINDAPIAQAQTISTDEDHSKAFILQGMDEDGDSLVFTVHTSPLHGMLSGELPNLLYTPGENFHGEDQFTFSVSDGLDASSIVSVNIHIASINDSPVIFDQSLTTSEDTTLSVNLEGTDTDGDHLTFDITQAPLHGSLSGFPPNIVYTPAPNFHGIDEFKFKATDGTESSAPAMIHLSIEAVNDAPTASSQSKATNEDTAVMLLLQGNDAEDDLLEFRIVQQPNHGSLSGAAPNLIYTPAPEFNGEDYFAYVVNDGLLESQTATVTVEVSPKNDAPLAISGSISGNEDAPVPIILTGTDKDGDMLSFNLTLQPEHGTLEGIAPNVTYKPDANFHGLDRFRFVVQDGLLTSEEAEIEIVIASVNDSPVAMASQVETLEDESIPIRLSGADADGDALTFTITTPPLHGSFSGSLPNLTYTPDPDFHGEDRFVFTANDGMFESPPATVIITVASVNDAPSAVSKSTQTNEDVAIPIVLSGTDKDDDSLAFTIVSPPQHGLLSGTPPNLIYAPAANFHGQDSFTYKSNDGIIDGEVATASISIASVNDLPIAENQNSSTSEDTPLEVILAATDIDLDTLEFLITEPPTHGILTGIGSVILYTPNANHHGPDSFQFIASDAEGSSSPATITLNVVPVNDIPAAKTASVETLEDSAVPLMLEALDADLDELSYQVIELPSHGVLIGAGPSLTYLPYPDFNGQDSFRFVASDGTATSPPASIVITVQPVNDAPSASPQSLTLAEDTSAAITLTGEDVEDDLLSFMILIQPSHGSLAGSPPNIIYTPAPDYHGPDLFRYVASDGSSSSPATTVTISVSPQNDAPIAIDGIMQTLEDTPAAITLQASDIDADLLTFVVKTSPSHGQLSGLAPNLVYIPESNFSGQDMFSFEVTDASGERSSASISISILPVNDAPFSETQSLETQEETPLSIHLSANDVEGDAFNIEITVPPAHGNLTGTLPEMIYTPALNYNGPDSFAFRAKDGTSSGGSAVIEILVHSINDAPETTFDVFSVEEDSILNVSIAKSVVRNDSDSHENAPGESNQPLKALLVAGPTHATSFTLMDNGTFIYEPRPNFHGIDSFTYRAQDSLGGTSDVETVLIAVSAVNDAPVTAPLNLTTLEDVSIPIKLRSADADMLILFDPSDWLGIPPPNFGPAPHDADPNFVIVTPPLHGTLTGIAPNLVYTPAPNYHGADQFSYAANDGLAVGLPAMVSITVQADTDADLLPDAWEMTAFFSLSVDAGGDPDGDGQDNAFELLAGTNPNNSTEFLGIESVGSTPASGQFRLNAVRPGVRYILESSTDLQRWETAAETTYEIEGAGAIADPRMQPVNATRGFYRVTLKANIPGL